MYGSFIILIGKLTEGAIRITFTKIFQLIQSKSISKDLIAKIKI